MCIKFTRKRNHADGSHMILAIALQSSFENMTVASTAIMLMMKEEFCFGETAACKCRYGRNSQAEY